jgi:peptidyl-prolyl cis-trans isomerase C
MLTLACSIKKKCFLLILGLSLFFLSSCDFFSRRILVKPVVQVESIKFTAKDFSSELALRMKDFDALSAKDPKILTVQKDQIVNDFIVFSLIDLWFLENKMSVTKEELESEIKKISAVWLNDSSFRGALSYAGITFAAWSKKTESALKKTKLINHLIKSSPPIGEVELKSYYNNNRSRYEQKEAIFLSHILVSDENQANIILKLLKKQKFSDVSKEYSSAYRKETTDAFGWVEKGYMIELDRGFKMRLGDLIGPIKMDDGLHIFKIIEKKPYKIKTYLEAKNEVLADVLSLREKALFAAWLDVQFKRYKIKKNKAVLDSIKVETQ